MGPRLAVSPPVRVASTDAPTSSIEAAAPTRVYRHDPYNFASARHELHQQTPPSPSSEEAVPLVAVEAASPRQAPARARHYPRPAMLSSSMMLHASTGSFASSGSFAATTPSSTPRAYGGSSAHSNAPTSASSAFDPTPSDEYATEDPIEAIALGCATQGVAPGKKWAPPPPPPRELRCALSETSDNSPMAVAAFNVDAEAAFYNAAMRWYERARAAVAALPDVDVATPCPVPDWTVTTFNEWIDDVRGWWIEAFAGSAAAKAVVEAHKALAAKKKEKDDKKKKATPKHGQQAGGKKHPKSSQHQQVKRGGAAPPAPKRSTGHKGSPALRRSNTGSLVLET